MTIIDKRQFDFLDEQGFVVDGTFGGLVVGRSHDHGGVPLLRGPFDGTGHYEQFAEMEGLEFLMNTQASIFYQKEIEDINNEMDQIMSLYSLEDLWSNLGKLHPNLPTVSVIIDNDIEDYHYPSKYLVISANQFIVNRFSSILHFDRLYEMNKRFKDEMLFSIG